MTASKKTLKALKATAAFKVFQASETKDIRALGAEEIAQAAPLAHYLKNKTDLVDSLVLGFSILFCFVLCAMVFMGPMSTVPSWSTTPIGVTVDYAAVVILLAIMTAKEVNDEYFKEVRKFVQTLKPLNELGACERALSLAKEFSACNDYRESVLSQGRAFLSLDLYLMERIAKNVEEETRPDRTLKACKELHSIPA